MSYTRKYILTLLTVVAIIFVGRSRLNTASLASDSLSLNSGLNSDSTAPISSTASPEQLPSQPSSNGSRSGESSQAPAQATRTPTPSLSSNNQTGRYKDGTYTGQSADAYYGNVQVQAVVTDGKVAKINFISYPSDNGRSLSISNYALPQLRTEAIQSQSARVNAISGASFTSQAFTTSLQSALSQA